MNRPAHVLLFQTAPDACDGRGLRMFGLTYVGAFVFAALFSYPVYLAFQSIGAGFPEETFRGWLAEQKLYRISDRLRLVAALLGTIWLIGYAGLWGNFGFSGSARIRTFFRWMVLGVAMLAIPVGLQLLTGESALKPHLDGAGMAAVVAGAVATALIVSFLEESVFRGMLLRLFATALRTWPAIFFSALVFAAVHFKSVRWMRDIEPSWFASFQLSGASFFAPVLTFDLVLFTNLLLVGMVLNLLFWRSGNLIACFGLHAGWVLAQRTAVGLFESRETPWSPLFGSPLVTDGALAVLLVGALTVLLAVNPSRLRPGLIEVKGSA